MRTLIWRHSALDQLDSLVGYIAERDRNAAENLAELIQHNARLIQNMPHIGRPGRVSGTREWIIHPNYILVYRLTGTIITVLRVLHARQRYPK